MKVGFFQIAPRFGDRDANLTRVEKKLREYAARHSQTELFNRHSSIVNRRSSVINRKSSIVHRKSPSLVVLPELFSTGYNFASRSELLELAEDIRTGPTVKRLQALADHTGLMIAAGIAERSGRKVYNSGVLVAPLTREPVLTYRKIHLFGREKALFTPGNRRAGIVDVNGIRFGLEICFDHFFPELTRALALKGVQIICHPANLVLRYAQQTTVARALENGIFWVLCNRTGTERHDGRELTFTGQSQVVGPRGRILSQAGPRQETLKFVEIDPADADNKCVFRGNDLLKDRRPGMYRT